MANGLPPLEKLKKKELPPLNSLKKKGDGTPQPETTSQPTGVITQPLAQASQQGTQPPAFEVEYGTSGFSQGLGGLSVGQQRLSQEKLAPIQEKETKELEARQKENDIKLQVNNIVDKNKNQFDQEINAKKAEYELKVKEIQSLQNKDSQQFEAFNKQIEDISSGFDLYQNQQAELYKNDIERRKQDVELRIEQINSREYKNQNEVDLANKTIESIVKDFENYQNTRYSEFEQNINNRYAEIQTATQEINNQQIQIQQNFETTNNRLQQLTNEFNDWQNQRAQQLNEKVNTEIGDFYSKQIKPQEKETRISQSLSAIKSMRKEQIDNQIKDYGIPIIPETTQVPKKSRIVTKDVVVPDQSVIVEKYIKENQSYLPKSESENLQEVAIGVGINKFNEYMKSLSEEEKSKLSVAEIEMLKSRYVDNEARAIQGDIKQMLLAQIPKEKQTTENLKRIEQDLWDNYRFGIDLSGDNEWNEKNSIQDGAVSFFVGASQLGGQILYLGATLNPFLNITGVSDDIKGWVESVNEKSKNILQEYTSQSGSMLESLKTGNYLTFAKQSLSTLASSAPAMILSGATGNPYLGYAALSLTSGTQTYLDVKDEEFFKELSDAGKVGYVGSIGAIEGLSELVGAKILGGMVDDMIKGLATPKTKKEFLNWFIGTAKANGINITADAATEMLPSVTQYLADSLAKGEKITFDGIKENALEGFLGGFGMVGVTSTVTTGLPAAAYFANVVKQDKLNKKIIKLNKEYSNSESKEERKIIAEQIINTRLELNKSLLNADKLYKRFSLVDKTSYSYRMAQLDQAIAVSEKLQQGTTAYEIQKEKIDNLYKEITAIEEKYAQQEEQKTPVVEKMSSKMGEILDTEKTPVVTEEEEKAPEVFEEEIVIPEEEIEKLNYDIARVEDEGTFGDNINQKAYRGSEEGMIKIDPQNENTIIFETNDKIYELGNKDEIGSELLSSQDITLTPPEGVNVVPKTNKTDVVSIDGKEYTVIGRRRDKKGKAVVRVKEVDTGLERRFVGEKAERILKDYNLRQGGKKVDIPDVKKQTEKPVVKTETKEEKRARKVEEKRKLEEMNQQEFDDAVAKSEKEVAEFEKAALDEAVKKAEKNKNKDLVQVNGNVYQVTKKDDGTFSVTKMREDGKLVRITDKAETSKAVAQFKREKTNQEKAALKEAEKMIKDVKKEEQDKILNLLDKLIDSTSSRGRVYDATLALPMFVANSSLKIVRASYKAGKSIAEAIKDGYNYVKSKGYGITEQEYKKYVAQNINKQQQSDTQDKAGIPSKEQKGQEPKQAKPKEEASGEKAETGRDVQTPKEKGRVTPDKTKEEVRVEPDEKEVKEVAEKAGITPKNLKDLYKIGRDMFGLNKVQAFAQAVVMDRMVGAMAKRARVSKKEMYGKLEFRKGSVAPKGSLKQAASGIWRSTAKEGISKVQQKAATPEQWVKMIADKGGKGTIQELEWIGLQDFLNDYAKENNLKSVPKEVVEQYIADNQIEIVEVTKGDRKSYIDDVEKELAEIRIKIREEKDISKKSKLIERRIELQEIQDEYIEKRKKEETKYSDYTLEGEKNYREVLLTLPERRQNFTFKVEKTEGGWSVSNEITGDWMFPVNMPTKEDAQKRADELNKQGKSRYDAKSNYKSSHWSEANILAHVRMNERTLPNGERVLFIEEVQSDWAQEGKKKGFGKREKITENDIEIISDEKEYYDSEMMGYDHRVKFRVKGFDDIDSVTYNDGLNSKERSITDLKKRLANDYNRELLQEGRTLDMPYKKTDQWVGMAMRRAMQMAANEGFDRIAWTTGEQQFNRYGSSKIAWEKQSDGSWNVDFREQVGGQDDLTPIEDQIIKGDANVKTKNEFRDVVESLLSRERGEYSAENFEKYVDTTTNKIWGRMQEENRGKSLPRKEGMEGFYNSILPKAAKKEAQRFDKKAGIEVVSFEKNMNIEYNKFKREYWELYNEKENLVKRRDKKEISIEEYEKELSVIDEKFEKLKNNAPDGITFDSDGMFYFPPNVSVEMTTKKESASKQLSIAITPEMRMNLNGAVPLFQDARGAMLAADGNYIIYALTDPNVSTPLHELAHVFEHYLTEAERTSVLKWAGATEWTTEVSEKFARGFEKYLADGKAPTVSLQKIFNRFKEWLTDIYNGIVGSDIDIQLNDEMRDLYGKMLGVDAVKEQEKKSFANIIRGLKIDTTGKAFDATLGLPVAIYNNAIEITAKAVEAGVEVKKAIQKGIDYANKKMNGKKWDVEGFRNQLLTTIKGQFEQQAAQMRSSKKEVKTPKTRFLGFLTRSGAKIVNANDYIDSMKTNMNLDVSDTKKRIDDAKSKARKVFAKTNKIKNDKEVANIVNDLLNRIISPDEYNMTAQEAIDKIRKDIKNPKVAQELIDAGLDIRTQIDNMTKFMLENAEKFNLSDEAIENLKSNIGNYIHREYMFFSERGKTFRKQSLKTRRLEKWNPTDEMINEAIAEHAIYNGISVDEAKKQIEDLIKDWKKKRTPIKVTGNNVIRIQDVKVEADLMKGRVRIPQNFTLFSEASKEAEKELQKKGIDSENKNYNTLLSVETERIYKDKGGEYVELPPHLRKLLGEERNATQRYINTMLAMSNMVYKAQAMDMIVKSFDGKDGWIYDKEPANNEGDYKLVNDKYSPLNGKWVNIYLIEEFNKLPIYETDLAIAKAYFEYQSLVRTTKTAANPPTNFKNVIGGIFAQMQNGFFIALTNPKLAALSIYSRGHLYFKGRRNELAKQVLKDGAEAGVLSSSVDVEVLGLKGSILSERVKFGKSELGRRYAQQDDWTKSLMVYLYKQDVSLMLFGKKFDDLSKDQQKEVLIKTGSLTKKGVPTFSNLPSWFRTISRLPTGDFMSFTVEATRSLIGSGIIAYEHARAASTGVDSKGNTINETQRRAYAKDAAKRIAGLVAIQSVGKAIGAGAFSLGGSAIEYGSQVFAAIFGGGDDEDENDETKLAKIQVVKEINKTIPDWAVGDRVIVTNVDDDGNVTFYNWTGLEPSSETAQLIGGNFKYFEQFYKGSITAKMLIQLYNNENEIGNEIYLEDEPLYKQVFNSAYFLGKNTLLPPFINSTEYEIKRRKEDDENFGVISQDNTVEENAQSAKELTQVFLSRATIRSYNYNIYNRVKQIAYAQSRHGRVDNLDNIKEEEQIDLRLKNISVIRDAYQICLKHRITTPDSPAKIKKISELNDAVKRNYTDFEEAMIYETDDAKFKEMYDFVMSKSKDIVEYNKLKDERKK